MEQMFLKEFGSENYDSILQQKVYAGHMEICPMLLVDCDFASHGCPARMTRKDKEEHEQNFLHEHTQLLNSSLKRAHSEKYWHDGTICWDFPTHRVMSLAVGSIESQRSHIGLFDVFLKMQVDHNSQHNTIQVFICVENPKHPPLIDRVNIRWCDVPAHYEVQCPLLNRPQRMTRDPDNPSIYQFVSNLHLCPPSSDHKHRRSRECGLAALQKIFDYSKQDALLLDAEFRLRYDNVFRVGCFP
jgi:hypothetical protein